ncbi:MULTISPECIES: ATP-binding protein [unclassified Streptomyces]|uniref:ATP-binding protein n=1 Tax=unclassified Streptomyces TaxID=2593676 RepID=UPI00095DDE32|nr:ATP-binding protein [Streptomyces sp. CB01883]OKJ81069.1 DNA gyrase [Streptomyces sp. CB01883]
MDGSRNSWANTTHDWDDTVDKVHLGRIRDNPAEFGPGGPEHLVLEVVAYAADEAASRGGGSCVVTLHTDGSVSVRDDGRGTDTRVDEHGQVVKKPVMSTKDLRFFDLPETERLPDGHPRRGMSVVAALSEWLIHTNRRLQGSWSQRYEHGIPVTDLQPVEADGSTGTCVRFLPYEALRSRWLLSAGDVGRWSEHWPDLTARFDDQRAQQDRFGP